MWYSLSYGITCLVTRSTLLSLELFVFQLVVLVFPLVVLVCSLVVLVCPLVVSVCPLVVLVVLSVGLFITDPSRCVIIKRCSENMQKIYKKIHAEVQFQ